MCSIVVDAVLSLWCCDMKNSLHVLGLTNVSHSNGTVTHFIQHTTTAYIIYIIQQNRTLTNAGTQKTIYKEKQAFQIDPWTPHLLFFLKDTILTEWWEADEFQCYYYHPYRKIIDVQNSLIARENNEGVSPADPLHPSATGRYQRLIPQDESSLAAAMSRNGTLVGRLGALLVVAAAAAAGVVVGITIGVAMGEGGGGSGSSSSGRETQAQL